jgi:hypothetical protein
LYSFEFWFHFQNFFQLSNKITIKYSKGVFKNDIILVQFTTDAVPTMLTPLLKPYCLNFFGEFKTCLTIPIRKQWRYKITKFIENIFLFILINPFSWIIIHINLNAMYLIRVSFSIRENGERKRLFGVSGIIYK